MSTGSEDDFVGEDQVAAAPGHAGEPRHAGLLIFAELAVEDGGIELGTRRRIQNAVVVQLQAEEIDRVYRMYPKLNDDEFVRRFLQKENA